MAIKRLLGVVSHKTEEQRSSEKVAAGKITANRATKKVALKETAKTPPKEGMKKVPAKRIIVTEAGGMARKGVAVAKQPPKMSLSRNAAPVPKKIRSSEEAPAKQSRLAKKGAAQKPMTTKSVPETVTNPAPERQPPALPPKTMEKLHKLLEEERATYVRQAEALLAEAEALTAEREPGDVQFDEESGEGDTLNVERERDLTLSASARQAVEEIDRALERMKAGAFGYCMSCGAKIPIARLEALPYAALCIQCKAREERRR